tara:strand:- start:143 stop:709 length:567 start_codon:yes stop_codon:yes gene_type:complete
MKISDADRDPSSIKKDNIDTIKIVDNFFEKELFSKIQKHISTKIYYTPAYFTGTTEKTKENYYGDRWLFVNDKKFLSLFVDQVAKKFKIKPKTICFTSAIDLRNLDHFKPHTDSGVAKINILIMLKGPSAVTNGTVFYTDKELDIHVGFKENRAVLFPSARFHSQHASKIPNLKRYTATIFIQDYEEE